MGKYFVSILLLLLFFETNSQSIEGLEKRAALLVHADLTDFDILDKESLSDVYSIYNIKRLESSLIYECYFFEITNLPCQECKDCKMLLAYSSEEKRFFRLKGFKFNEFSVFYNAVLLGEYLANSSSNSKRRAKKILLKETKIEGYDISQLYEKYYHQKKVVKYDSESCYFKSVITIYE